MKLQIPLGDGRMVEMLLTPDLIEQVLAEWEQENPGKKAFPDMGPDEFVRRVMIEIEASARLTR